MQLYYYSMISKKQKKEDKRLKLTRAARPAQYVVQLTQVQYLSLHVHLGKTYLP
jgi:hypothetical protein